MRYLIIISNLLFLATAPALAQSFTISEEDPPAECQLPLIAGSFLCEGSFCDEITVECNNLDSDIAFSEWTHWVEHDGRRKADCADPLDEGRDFDTTVMTGLACRGSFCDDISVRCTAMRNFVQGPDDQCEQFTRSDGDNVLRLPFGTAIRALTCEGQHCDNVTVTVCPMVPR